MIEVNSIRVGRIVRTIRDAGNGIFGSKLVKLAIPGNSYEIDTYAKPLGEMDLLVELMAALLGREIGLPIPESALAISYSGRELLFASIDVKAPDLTRRLNFSGDQLADTSANRAELSKLAAWRDIQKAICFDEWIADADRNLGNILYEGKDKYWLIDHNLAMGLPFAPNCSINNQLLAIKLLYSNDELSRQRIKRGLETIASTFQAKVPLEAAKKIRQAVAVNEDMLNNIVMFLSLRLESLPQIAQSKVNTRQQSL